MSGQHAAIPRRKPVPAIKPIKLPPLSWPKIRKALLDVADALFRCVVAGIASLLMSTVIILVAKAFYEAGEPSAAAMTVAFGFGAIVRVLVWWAVRESKR